jgi:hypothetical protein
MMKIDPNTAPRTNSSDKDRNTFIQNKTKCSNNLQTSNKTSDLYKQDIEATTSTSTGFVPVLQPHAHTVFKQFRSLEPRSTDILLLLQEQNRY